VFRVWLRRLGVCRRCRSRGETRADVGWGWAGGRRGLGMLALQRAGTRLSAAVTRRGSLEQAGLCGELFFLRVSAGAHSGRLFVTGLWGLLGIAACMVHRQHVTIVTLG
jgi:hypothetical protein